MDYYLTGIEGMPKLLDCCNNDVMQYFQKKVYSDSFRKMYDEYSDILNAVENGYNTADDREKFLTDMAEALTDHAEKEIEACRGKSKKEKLQMDLNMTMAVFVLPMILELHGNSSEPLSAALTDSWKRKFPKTNLKAAEYKSIEEGFHKQWCYITTAVCHALGKGDDCYELNLLRNYRDTYLARIPRGEELIAEYYDIAPSIVKHINQQPDSGKIYQSIWQDYLMPCIRMIENNQNEQCLECYSDMVHTLRSKYFMTFPGQQPAGA